MSTRPAVRPSTVVLSLIAMVAVAAAVAFGVLWGIARSDLDDARAEAARVKPPVTAPAESGQRDAVAEVAKRVMSAMSSYDHQTIETQIDSVRADITDRFLKELDGAKRGLVKTIKDQKASSTGTVTDVAVAQLDARSATVLIFLDQQVTNAKLAGPRTDRNRVRLTLVNQNGRWLVDKIELV